jgi:hypothetical protein
MAKRRIRRRNPGYPAGSIGAAIPVDLAYAIAHGTSLNQQAIYDMLHSWSARSGVGSDCVKLAKKASALVKGMGDRQRHDRNGVSRGVIDVSPIWDAVAHQCLVYAFS